MAEDSGEWISWSGAAQLTGVPVHTIEWWKRQGRIEHRAEDKRRPTLRRSSVEEFGRWYWAREEERRERPPRVINSAPPEPEGWLKTAQAAERLGLSITATSKLKDDIGAVRRGRNLWFPIEGIERLDRERAIKRTDEWVSMVDAARIVGCHPSTLLRYVKRGLIEQRPAHQRPSLRRTSVERFAARWSQARYDRPELLGRSRRVQ